MYALRTKDGQRTAEVDNQIAGRMIREMNGQWTEKNFSVVGKKTVYQFTEAGMFGNSAIQLWISAGFYLIQES